MADPQSLFNVFIAKPATMPASYAVNLATSQITPDALKLLTKVGLSPEQVDQSKSEQAEVTNERVTLYREIDRATDHPLIKSATELYAEYSTTPNEILGCTMWVSSDNSTYAKELNDMLNRIGLESKLNDWAWTTATYGDMFIRVKADPTHGIIAVEDDFHPIDISRVDVNGILAGFYQTPFGDLTNDKTVAVDEVNLFPPWDYVHLRLGGAKKKRAVYGKTDMQSYQTMLTMGVDTRQLSTNYGTSIILNAIPVYKRLRLAEDSIMLARQTRGIERNIYVVKVDNTNFDAAASLIDHYKNIFKNSQAMDMSSTNPRFEQKWDTLAANQDVILPVWGDTNGIKIDKVGGDVDIRWIADIEDLRQQLACALRVPLQLMGGYIKEASGSLGSEALSKLDIRFARSTRRLQKAIKEGVTRLCQIHLAYKGMSPDYRLFKVHIAETSSGEENQLKEALKTASDVTDSMASLLVDKLELDINKAKLFSYLNAKILKLNDFDINQFLNNPAGGEPEPARPQRVQDNLQYVPNMDYMAYLPDRSGQFSLNEEKWNQVYGSTRVKTTINEKSQKPAKKSSGK